MYKSQDVQDQKERAIQNVLSEHQRETCTVLAVSESRVMIDSEMKQRMMAKLRIEDQYSQIIEMLEDPTQANQVQKNDKTYRMKQGTLKVHEERQPTTFNYWRGVVPNDQDIKTQLLREIHAVPYVGHPGYMRTLEVTKQFFY